jgi:SpoVK/Ycf46/Vps4 family AAA+-type ATPase
MRHIRQVDFFDDLSGLSIQKKNIEDGFINPLIYPNLYPSIAKGMLFYGPPGTGKTLIAKAAVNELQTKSDKIRVLFYNPTGASLKGKYVGETEKNIIKYFKCANEDAENLENQYPDVKYISIIFLDEVESIAGNRSCDQSGIMTNSVNTLLQMIDGIDSPPKVSVIAATNYPWKLDSAILRRFTKRIFLDLPDAETIIGIILSEIDKHFKLDKSKFINNKTTAISATAITKSSNKVRKQRGVYSDFCLKIEKPEKTHIYDSDLYKNWMKNFKIDEIKAFAMELYRNKYSASDVSNLCKEAFIGVANRAISNNVFYLVNDVPNIDQLYVSSLCFDDDREPKFILDAPVTAYIAVNEGNTSTKFINSIYAPKMYDISNNKKLGMFIVEDSNNILQIATKFILKFEYETIESTEILIVAKIDKKYVEKKSVVQQSWWLSRQITNVFDYFTSVDTDIMTNIDNVSYVIVKSNSDVKSKTNGWNNGLKIYNDKPNTLKRIVIDTMLKSLSGEPIKLYKEQTEAISSFTSTKNILNYLLNSTKKNVPGDLVTPAEDKADPGTGSVFLPISIVRSYSTPTSVEFSSIDMKTAITNDGQNKWKQFNRIESENKKNVVSFDIRSTDFYESMKTIKSSIDKPLYESLLKYNKDINTAPTGC